MGDHKHSWVNSGTFSPTLWSPMALLIEREQKHEKGEEAMQARHAERQTYLKSDLPDIVCSFNRQNAFASLEATALTTLVAQFQKSWRELCQCSLVFPALPWFLPLSAQLAAAAAAAAVSKIPLPAMGSTRLNYLYPELPPAKSTPCKAMKPMQRETTLYWQFGSINCTGYIYNIG